jgi:hypothetical protein
MLGNRSDGSASMDELVEPLRRELDLEEKVSLPAGRDFWSLRAIPRIGLLCLDLTCAGTIIGAVDTDPPALARRV